MKHQPAFDRVLEIEDARLARQIVRYIFAEYPNDRQPLSKAEIAALKSIGVSLNLSARFSHGDAVNAARDAARHTDSRRVCDAFLHGLDPKFMLFRSPLRALSLCRNLPTHRYVPWRDPKESPCSVCGVYRTETADPVVDAHFVNQQGTTGSDASLIVSAWTLNWFRKIQFPTPGAQQFAKLNELLKLIANAPGNHTAVKIAAICNKVLGGNKYSRESFFETLGLAGVLHVPQLPGLLQEWTRWDRRPRHREMIAPAAIWRRKNGINPVVFAKLFPQCEIPKSLIAPAES